MDDAEPRISKKKFNSRLTDSVYCVLDVNSVFIIIRYLIIINEIISTENQEAEEFLTQYLLEDIVIRAMMVSPIITLIEVLLLVNLINCTGT